MNTKIIIALVIGIAMLGTMGVVSANWYEFNTPDLGSYTPSSWDYGQYNPETGVMSLDVYIPGHYIPPADAEDTESYEFIKPDLGSFTPGFYTSVPFDTETLTQLPDVYTPGFYTPPVDVKETATLEYLRMPYTPRVDLSFTRTLPTMEELIEAAPGVPEANGPIEDLVGPDIPEIYMGGCLVP